VSLRRRQGARALFAAALLAVGPSLSAQDAVAACVHVFPVIARSALRFGAYHHDYPAVDIFTPIGSEVLAVTDGVVDFVSRVDRWEPATNLPEERGGISVSIVGDDGARYYTSHLSFVLPGIEHGVRVKAGELIALSGQSGDARPMEPHVHFGISRASYPEDWRQRRGTLAPYPFLIAWQAGTEKVPFR
jgi:peptidoglycan LD-endopeptidase LytH